MGKVYTPDAGCQLKAGFGPEEPRVIESLRLVGKIV
jgi:hypothetical protein